MILSNNIAALKFGIQDYVHQLFRQLIHVYVANPKAKADNIVLVPFSAAAAAFHNHPDHRKYNVRSIR